ncbi:MAG: CHAT domain-containing protein [Oscillatoriales cyanobacterium]|nr:CHAT domain-containing protein [Microcoleus sp. PH2017_30_WIL_O_A]TAE68496.1 MAG: CHAT domain-containing protein [Oscillatoriales cyanobacterium]
MAADGEQNAGFLQQLAGQISQALAQGTQGGNADRNSAYLQLINALLSCPNGEEPQILSANSEFLDLGFMQACEAVAASLAEQGEENGANYLRNLASQVGELLGMREEGNSDSLAFLMQLLQTVGDDQGNGQQVYIFLQQNLDKLDLQLVQILTAWANDTLAQVEGAQANGIATVIHNLGNLIQQFPLGSRLVNLEIAISCYEIVSTVFNREAFAEYWATIQNNLAAAYTYRIRGEKAHNIEMAIRYCTVALEVRTRDAFPQDWATIQNNLANAYGERIRGEKAQNIEMAITSYIAALEVRTRDAFPQDWAQTQNNLAVAYSKRIRGEKAQNIEMAIRYYTATLEVYTREAFAEYWATIQNNLANAYRERIRGEKAQNIEMAIRYYTAALEVRTRDVFPEYWATTQNNLALAYGDRIRGEKADNIELAIASYTTALEVYSREAFPEQWAQTQNNLANAYSNRIKGEKAENIELAIASYTNALEVYTRDAFPEQWAQTQNNLAAAYSNRIRGKKAQNIEMAILYFRNALEVDTHEAFPQSYAQTLWNLGLAYRKVPNLRQAHDTFADAINTVEFMRSEIHSGDESKQKLAEEWNELYRNMVEVCIELKNYTAAIEYAERSKARNLVELLATRDLYPKGDIPETVINELSRLRREIDAEQRRLEIEPTNPNSNGGTISGERSPQIDNLQTTIRVQTNLTQLRQQLDELMTREIKPIDPDFALTQEVKGISYSEIQSLTAENTAILQWYITSDRLLTFIITPESPTPTVWQSSKADFKALENLANEYLKDYQENKTQWQKNLASRLQSLADILHLNDLLGRVAKKCDRLILIPHRFLHLLPLHALPVSREIWQRFNSETPSPEPTNPCPLDCFKQGVRYAPSCQLLQQAQRRERPNFTHLFAVQNPNNNLPFTDIEVPAIRQNFPPENQDILIQNNALKSVINDSRLRIAHCVHFSCHGYFNFQQPLLSALLLADSELPPPAPAESNPNRYQPLKNGNILDLDKCLTLADIFALDFRECRLVVLSACETGISDFSSISDEYISLPSGFLVAGSSSVVPTLWAVNDLSTSLLMIEFYQNLKAGLSVALALNKAQLWLRDVTVEKLQQWTSKLSIRPSLKEDLYDMLDNLDSTEQPPFRSHYHWAAFCATGQ